MRDEEALAVRALSGSIDGRQQCVAMGVAPEDESRCPRPRVADGAYAALFHILGAAIEARMPARFDIVGFGENALHLRREALRQSVNREQQSRDRECGGRDAAAIAKDRALREDVTTAEWLLDETPGKNGETEGKAERRSRRMEDQRREN